ncbi:MULTISPECIES: Panacea domain-containing protein [Gordonibacter]|uniref:DUF4065 domain-containing protein n=1 Tax=Gordonibacter faecis TaxID=3047475 RepID=A0ABT7DNQ7_9ACTN|nr:MULTISPECIES: type II toxin-antitoxin system antitoxin SocA domain-containing protein [unclassified Gordonibacter]MDJ1650193.1 DUF4065 domain-containing protein [Gordonibacter sp. KGMB12511]HIW75973.1 DUF4065 domain-containing protein [Candidatus Gordonibacter avicola]
MANVLDVAAYVLGKTGDVSTMKLQKLVYYSQAYHFVKTGRPLFSEAVEAWANGPVVPELFAQHRGIYVINQQDLPNARANHIQGEEAHTIDHVIEVLGCLTGAQLSDLTHSESPWRDARYGLPEGARSRSPIELTAMRNFYSSPACSNPVFA